MKDWAKAIVSWEFYFRVARTDPSQKDQILIAEKRMEEAKIKGLFPRV